MTLIRRVGEIVFGAVVLALIVFVMVEVVAILIFGKSVPIGKTEAIFFGLVCLGLSALIPEDDRTPMERERDKTRQGFW